MCSTVVTWLAVMELARAAPTSTLPTQTAPKRGRLRPGSELPTLSFAIVGDTRPANQDNVSGYPTAVITRIWQDVAAANPPFAVTTGNYMFASPTHRPSTAGPQLDLYLAAQANFKGPVYHAMGNHECTGSSASNCGAGNADGLTANYEAFMSKLVRPGGRRRPYYVENFHGTHNQWTAKFVIVAGNAWDAAQAAWLNRVLAAPTTYTFIVRNPPTSDKMAPCLAATGAANADAIIARHPFTLLIVGHTSTYAYYPSSKELIVGNGGAPLVGSGDYGYVIARQQANGKLTFTEYDYSTNAAMSSFTVSP
ncbi:MAG: hypothetical protein ACYC96_15005 [Fimbriimonadaceae bacterium]